MPSCYDMTGCQERVTPDDGRHENRWVALFAALILMGGAVGITVRQEAAPVASHKPLLSPRAQQQLTELAIALDEARFMASEGPWPTLIAMQQAGIPPFVDEPWQELASGCWLGPAVGDHKGRWLFTLPGEGVFWQEEGTSDHPDCTTPVNWILMTS